MRYLRALILLAAAILLATPPPALATARGATWADVGKWRVIGYSGSARCAAAVEFESGIILQFWQDRRAFSMVVTGVSTQRGMRHAVRMMTSDGQEGTFYGTGIDGDQVLFDNMGTYNRQVLARTRALAIQGLGALDLVGSAAAIREMLRCQRALAGTS